MAKRTRQPTTKHEEAGTPSPFWMRVFVWAVLAGAGFLGLWAFGLTANRVADVNLFASQGWGQHAQTIVANKIGALWHAAFMTLCAGGALWYLLLGRGRKGAKIVVWALVLLVAADAWLLSRNYVKTMPMSTFDENPVISILKKDAPERRVALLSQDGFYNSWLTFLFPYHGISAINTTQAPRMPADYKNFLGTVGRNPVRMWQLSAVANVLAPAEAWTQIQKDPAWKDAFDLVYSYNVARAEAGEVVIPATAQSPGKHVILRLKKPAPRFALIGGYEEVSDEEALKRLASPTYRLFEKVLVSPSSLPSALHREGMGGTGIVGTCKLVKYRSGYMELDVEADQAAILRVSEKYDKDWTATIDGQVANVYRVDYIFQGVMVSKGAHHVILKYAPPRWPLYGQGVGFAIVLCAVIGLLVRRVRNNFV